MKARVIVTLKSGVLDPQGKAIEGALKGLAIDGLKSVRQGKIFDIEIDGEDHAAARRRLARGLRAPARQYDRRKLRDRNRLRRRMRAAVILFPGINREGDAARALRQATGADARDRLARRARAAGGGGSRRPAGRILLRRLSALRRDRRARADHAGGRATTPRAAGWCSASATASRSCAKPGCLPGVLMRNAQRRFLCKMQHLRVENAQTPFTRRYAPGQVVKFAIAHGEGNFVADDETIERIEAEGRVAFRYCDAEGRVGDATNPNGSTNSIAGVFNERFNVLGLMPHPENLIDPLVGGVDGRALFASLAA